MSDRELREAERSAGLDPDSLKQLIRQQCLSGAHRWSVWTRAAAWHPHNIRKALFGEGYQCALSADPHPKGLHTRECFWCLATQRRLRVTLYVGVSKVPIEVVI